MAPQATPEIPKWLLIARRYIGTHEAPGEANNPVILGWAAKLGGWVAKYYKADSIPWCGLFVGFCMEEAGESTPGDALLGARNWSAWGVPVAAGNLAPGVVLVFERPGGGHVGFYEGEDAEAYHVTGGNQSDSVCTERILKAHCIARRWPLDVPFAGSPVLLTATGAPVAVKLD